VVPEGAIVKDEQQKIVDIGEMWQIRQAGDGNDTWKDLKPTLLHLPEGVGIGDIVGIIPHHYETDGNVII
jgi:hypothetical protein